MPVHKFFKTQILKSMLELKKQNQRALIHPKKDCTFTTTSTEYRQSAEPKSFRIQNPKKNTATK